MRDTVGGFGQKIMVQRDEMCLMLVARRVTGPVKWFEDRNENLLSSGKSMHEQTAVKVVNRPRALEHRRWRRRTRVPKVPR